MVAVVSLFPTRLNMLLVIKTNKRTTPPLSSDGIAIISKNGCQLIMGINIDIEITALFFYKTVFFCDFQDSRDNPDNRDSLVFLVRRVLLESLEELLMLQRVLRARKDSLDTLDEMDYQVSKERWVTWEEKVKQFLIIHSIQALSAIHREE